MVLKKIMSYTLKISVFTAIAAGFTFLGCSKKGTDARIDDSAQQSSIEGHWILSEIHDTSTGRKAKVRGGHVRMKGKTQYFFMAINKQLIHLEANLDVPTSYKNLIKRGFYSMESGMVSVGENVRKRAGRSTQDFQILEVHADRLILKSPSVVLKRVDFSVYDRIFKRVIGGKAPTVVEPVISSSSDESSTEDSSAEGSFEQEQEEGGEEISSTSVKEDVGPERPRTNRGPKVHVMTVRK